MYKVEADNLFDAWNQFLDQVCKSRNGDFDKYKSSAVAYAWFVWQKGYKGDTVIRWIN